MPFLGISSITGSVSCAHELFCKRPKHYQKRKDKLANVPVEDVPEEEISEAELKKMFPNGYDRLKDETYDGLAINNSF